MRPRVTTATLVLGLGACMGHAPEEGPLAIDDPVSGVSDVARIPDGRAIERLPELGDATLRIVTTSISTCVLAPAGTAQCWGNLPTTPEPVTLAGVFAEPRPYSDYDDIAEIVTGEAELCTLDADGRARCWNGGLPELPRLAELDMGREIKCARALGGGEGSIFCWPLWYPEQGSTLPDFGEVAQIDSKFDHACARTTDGHVHCWRRTRDGRMLAIDSDTEIDAPVRVSGLDRVVEIGVGGSQSCARRRDGTLWCWGGNYYGQLGDGTTTASTEPRRVLGIDDAVQLAVGAHHGCARERDGALWCWGWNHWQQLGDGTHEDRPTPIRLDLPPAKDLATYGAHTCTILESDVIRCWGENNLAQLGPYGPDARE